MGWLDRWFGIGAEQGWLARPPFATLDRREQKLVRDLMTSRKLGVGETAYEEGDEAKELLVVGSGAIELVKRVGKSGPTRAVGSVGVGETLGEYALLDGQPRSATARALLPTELFVLPFAKLQRPESKREKRAFEKLKQGLAELLASRLRAQAQTSLEYAQQREVMGQFIVNVLILVCAYVLFLNALPFFQDRIPASTSTVSLPLIAVFGYLSWRFIRSSGYPLSQFGMGFSHLIGSLVEALVLTIPFLALLTAFKGVLVYTIGNEAASIIQHPNFQARFRDPDVQTLVALYAASSLVQELIVRGALQSSLEAFLIGPGRRTRAIVVCALLFSISHLHISYSFALAALIPGLFWGWLFSRQPNLAGVWLSHVAVGSYVFFVLGINV